MNLPISQLSEADRARLEQLLLDFDQNWTGHHLGIMAGQLDAEPPEFKAAALVELVKIDLDYRQRNEPTRIEWYLDRFPELRDSSASLSELLQAEIAIRQAANDIPAAAELQQRFPALHDQVATLLANVAEQDEFSAIQRAKRQNPSKETSGSTTSIASAAQETLPPNQQRHGGQADANDDDSPQEFGRYRLLQELGRGAMGTVYLAEDTELRRRVALKRPRIAGTDEASLLERFYREAYAAANLDHPNICPVYDIGQHEGIPYITMAYVEGKPLSRVIRESRGLNARAVAVLLRKVAVALAEAHARGVIHRDLKPGNIMLNHRSEPIIMDFGLARQVEDVQERLTVDGTLIGTPGYMSPEQVDGDLNKVGPASDIYSLGVVLFELLTGRLPFQGSVAAVIGKIVRDQPPAPSSLRAGVPQQLEEICLKMMAKSPADRYATMSDVAEALGTFIKASGEGAAVTSPPPIETITPAQLAAQQKQLAQMIANGDWREASVQLQRTSELSDPVAAPYAKWAREQTAALHVRWQEEQRAAALALANAKEQFKRQDYVGAAQSLLAVNKQLLNVEAQQLLDQSLKLQEEVDLLIHLIERGLSGGSQAGMFKNMQRLLQLKPKDLLVRDLYRKFRWQQRLGWFGATLADAFSFVVPGRTRATLEEPMLRKWFALAALVFLISFGLMSWAVIIYLRGPNQTLAVEVDDTWLKEQGGQLSLTIDGHDHTLTGPGFDIQVTLGDHGFSVKSGDTIVHNPQTFTIEKEGRQILHIDANGMSLVARATPTIDAESNEEIVVDAPRTPLPDGPPGFVKSLDSHTGVITGLAFSPDGKTVASVSAVDQTLCVWDVDTNQPRHVVKVGVAYGLAIHPNGQLVVVSAANKTSVVDLKTGKVVATITGISQPGHSCAVSPNGKYLALHAETAGLLVYDITTLDKIVLVAEFPGGEPSGWANCMTFLPDSQHLLASTAVESFGTRLFHVPTRREVRRYVLDNGKNACASTKLVALHPSGRSFVFRDNDAWNLMQFNVDKEVPITTYAGTNEIATYSPDGRYLICGRWVSTTTEARSPETGTTIWQATPPDPHPKMIGLNFISVSPDGRYAVTGGMVDNSQNGYKTLKGIPNPLYLWRLPPEVWPKLRTDTETEEVPPAIPHPEDLSPNIQADVGQSPIYATDAIPFPKDARFVNARLIPELNTRSSTAEPQNAHPWLSPDGMRIWWTREGDGFEEPGIYQASRIAADRPFQNVRRVLANGRLACLSPDGLEIICTFDANGDSQLNELGTSRRKSFDEAFPALRQMTPFRQVENPKGTAFSTDGLSLLILSSRAASTEPNQILRATRTTTAAEWGAPVPVSIEGNLSVKNWTGPSLDPGGQHILLGYTETIPSDEWPAVADRTSNPQRFINARPILIDGQRTNTRAIR